MKTRRREVRRDTSQPAEKSTALYFRFVSLFSVFITVFYFTDIPRGTSV
jgi:hypothetical protein